MSSRKHIKATAGLIATALALSLGACSADTGETAGASEVFKMKFATYNPPSAAEAKASKWWADQINQRTSGQVEIEFYYQEALLAGTEILPGVGDGRADMGYVADAYYPAELPLTTVAGLPFITDDPITQSQVFAQLYESNDDFKQEWENRNVHVLTWAPTTPVGINTKDPIETLAQLENTKIRTIGFLADAIAQVGMVPVGLSQSEVYEALQRGVVDGSTVSLDVMMDRDFNEVAPNLIDTGTGIFAVTANVVNRDLWERLPDDVKSTIEEVSSEYLDVYEEQLAEREADACTEFLKEGGKIRALSAGDREAWRDASSESSRANWLNSVGDHVDSQAAKRFLGEYLDLVDELRTDYVSGIVRCLDQQ